MGARIRSPPVSMSARLGRVALEARRAAGASLLDIATEAGVSQAVLSRFETGVRGWPRRLDDIIAAYERVLGLERDALWRAALEEPFERD